MASGQKGVQDIVSTATAIQVTGVEFPISVNVAFDSETPMGLMTWNADHFEEKYYLQGDSTGVDPTRTKAYAAAGTDIPAQNYRLITVTVAVVDQADVGGTAYKKEAILEALIAKGDKFSVNLAAKDSSGNDTKAMFYSATAKTAPTVQGANTFELSAGTDWDVDTYTYTFKCGMYIDGNGSTYNQAVKGDVTATVAAVSPSSGS